MTTDYNTIAEEYRQAKQQRWRTLIESPSLMGLLGDVRGQRAIDLACGEGYYTRKVAALAPACVVGVDSSTAMIALANSQEAAEPLGIEYLVSDVRDLEPQEPYDVVLAAYLLNYARTREELSEMVDAIARCLRPGGRFVTVNSNPALFTWPTPSYEKYGFATRVGGPAVEGSPVTWTFHLAQESISVENYFLSIETHEAVFAEHGMVDVRWQSPQLSSTAASLHAPDYWNDFLARPPAILLECVKR